MNLNESGTLLLVLAVARSDRVIAWTRLSREAADRATVTGCVVVVTVAVKTVPGEIPPMFGLPSELPTGATLKTL
jgi:hypothetical protein